MGGKESALLTVLLLLARASHKGAQQILLEAIAHFYTVTDDYTVLHKFQSIFFPQGQQQFLWASEHLKGRQSG